MHHLDIPCLLCRATLEVPHQPEANKSEHGPPLVCSESDRPDGRAPRATLGITHDLPDQADQIPPHQADSALGAFPQAQGQVDQKPPDQAQKQDE